MRPKTLRYGVAASGWQGGFISRTSIGYFWSGFTIGFRRSGKSSPSFGQRPSFVGIGPAFAAIGVGNHALEADGRRSAWSCAP